MPAGLVATALQTAQNFLSVSLKDGLILVR
jgi:hypothetical protein